MGEHLKDWRMKNVSIFIGIMGRRYLWSCGDVSVSDQPEG